LKSYLIYLNVGLLAVDNGATNAISKMYDIAELVDSYITSDGYWGSDQFRVSDDKLELVIQILFEEKIPHRIHQHPEGGEWKGLFAEAVRHQCRVGADYNPKYEQLHF